MKIALAFVAMLTLVAAQDPPKPAAKVAKDQAEADLINSIPKEADGTKRLAILDKWSKDYPETAFADDRDEIYLATYQQLQKPREAFDKSVAILNKHPENFLALSTIIAYLPYLNNGNPAAADMDTAEKASNKILQDTDGVFSAANKPASIPDAQWGTLKTTMPALAQKTIGYIYFQKKDNARAETELKKALQMDPTQALASYQLAQAMFAQRTADPAKQPPAIFEFARTAAYDGPNALPAPARAQIKTTATKYYTAYHGSAEGLDKVMELAKTNALPPADFTIVSTAQIATQQAQKEAAEAAANPSLAMWKTIKDGLTGANPDQFFDGSVKDAALPGGANGATKFKGKLISAKPATRPKELTIAVENPTVADCVIKLEEGQTLPGTMEPGGDIEFEGVAKSYTKEPYMLTLEADKDKIAGWTGKNAPAAKKAGGAVKKKAQ